MTKQKKISPAHIVPLKKLFLFIPIMFFTLGCGVYQQYQQRPEVIAEDALSNDRCNVFGYCIDDLMLEDDGKVKIQKLLEDSEKAHQCYLSYLNSDIDRMVYKSDVKKMLSKIEKTSQFGIINDSEATSLNAKVKDRVLSGNKNDDFQIFLGEDLICDFPELKSDEHQKYIFDRTLNKIAESESFRSTLIKPLMIYLQKNDVDPKDVMRVKSTFEEITLSKQNLEQIKEYFPEFAETRMKEVTIKVFFALKNSDAIERQDLYDVLKEKAKGVVWCNGPGDGIANLVIERVRNNERTLPDQKETISYTQDQIGVFDAALLMPRGATYMYDIQSGGAEIEYGYVVSMVSGNNKTYENIVRGKLKEKYGYCLNARIRNVFGGVSPARFIANSDMEYRCNNGYAKSVSIDALRL